MTAEKPESVEICFVPDDDYVGVLERHLPADAPALAPGPLVTTGGEVVGEHGGYARFTIGQRRGLPGGFGAARYVVAIQPGAARGGDRDCRRAGGPSRPARGAQLAGRRRSSRATSARCRCATGRAPFRPRSRRTRASALELVLEEPVRAITPGQSGVLYAADDRVLGGGVIG